MGEIIVTAILYTIILVGIAILYFTVKNLLPGYFKQKGKNLATKEDISEITRLVESVRHTFTKETEQLKIRLQFVTSLHGSLLSEERNTIIDVNEKYFYWLNLFSNGVLGVLDIEDNADIQRFAKHIEESYASFVNSQTRFDLFIDNLELTKGLSDLRNATLEKLHTLTSHYLLKEKFKNREIASATSAPSGLKDLDRLRKEKLEIRKEFISEMLAAYKDIVTPAFQFQRACRKHLYQLLGG